MKQKIPLIEVDNVPIEQKKKKVSSHLAKKLTKDEPLLENDQSLSPTKTKESTTLINKSSLIKQNTDEV